MCGGGAGGVCAVLKGHDAVDRQRAALLHDAVDRQRAALLHDALSPSQPSQSFRPMPSLPDLQ